MRGVMGWDGMGGWTESPNERGEEGSLPFSPTRPPDVSQFYFLSVFHLTVQMWADEVASCSENKGTLGMFHSVLKHAEHRTLNTYTQQLVLSKCRFFGVFFQTQSGFRLHRTQGNQSHQIRQTASNHKFCIYVMHAT